MSGRPAIGTTLWTVREHLYYIPGQAGPEMEYVVCDSTVTGYYEGGYVEICTIGLSPGGYRTPYRHRLSDLGRNVFYTPKEAAGLAEQATEIYESKWRKLGYAPLRRTWEKYLKEDDTNESKT